MGSFFNQTVPFPHEQIRVAGTYDLSDVLLALRYDPNAMETLSGADICVLVHVEKYLLGLQSSDLGDEKMPEGAASSTHKSLSRIDINLPACTSTTSKCVGFAQYKIGGQTRYVVGLSGQVEQNTLAQLLEMALSQTVRMFNETVNEGYCELATNPSVYYCQMFENVAQSHNMQQSHDETILWIRSCAEMAIFKRIAERFYEKNRERTASLPMTVGEQIYFLLPKAHHIIRPVTKKKGVVMIDMPGGSLSMPVVPNCTHCRAKMPIYHQLAETAASPGFIHSPPTTPRGQTTRPRSALFTKTPPPKFISLVGEEDNLEGEALPGSSVP